MGFEDVQPLTMENLPDLDMNFLSGTWFENTFSCLIGYLINVLSVSLDM